MKTLFPHSLCFWIGYVLLFILSAAFIFVAIYTIGWCLYRYVWMNDWFAFNIRRHRISTEKLREGYGMIKMNKYWTRYTAKYRLRNIRNIK